jgi:hypothetical protein
MPTPSTMVTAIPPGFTMSWLSTEARPLADRVTVTLCPDAIVPEDCESRTVPIRLDGSAMDHVTGPPDAVRVTFAPVIGLSRIAVGLTLRVPGGVGGGGEEVLLAGVEPVDRRAQQRAQLRALGAAGDVRRLIAHLRQQVQCRGGRAGGLAQAPMALVTGHGVQPWPEPARITKSRQLGRRDDKGVLHGVGGIGGLAQQGAAVGVQRRCVPVISLGQPVRVACHNGRNDLTVAQRT